MRGDAAGRIIGRIFEKYFIYNIVSVYFCNSGIDLKIVFINA